jgi:hypothetical protein
LRQWLRIKRTWKHTSLLQFISVLYKITAVLPHNISRICDGYKSHDISLQHELSAVLLKQVCA